MAASSLANIQLQECATGSCLGLHSSVPPKMPPPERTRRPMGSVRGLLPIMSITGENFQGKEASGACPPSWERVGTHSP